MNKIDLIYISSNKKDSDKKFSSNDVLSISYWNETSLKFHELEMCIPYQYDICIGQKYNQTNVCLTENHSTDYDGICCFCIPGYEMGKNSFLYATLENVGMIIQNY